jgi:signal transduction histidine kinase
MKQRTAARLAWSLFAVGTGFFAFDLWMNAIDKGILIAVRDRFGETLPVLSFGFVGALIASRRPHNRIGWLLLVLGTLGTAETSGNTVETYALVTHPGAIPGGIWFAWIDDVVETPIFVSFVVLFPLLFPTGRLPSRRWRPVSLIAVAVIVEGTLWSAFAPKKILIAGADGKEMVVGSNPVGIEALRGFFEVADKIAEPLFPALLIAAIVSLVVRYRRHRGDERQQIKWVLYAMGLFLVFFLIVITEPPFLPVKPEWAVDLIFGVIAMGIPVAAAISILRYRLYDIDVVINKTVVYGALAAFITTIYVGVVVGVGSLIGQGDRPNLGLSLLATALVAVAFQPVRERVQSFANKLVYGERVTPYEAVTSFSHRMAESLSFDQVLPQMAEAAAKGVGGNRSQVKLFLPGGGEQVVAWPTDSSGNSFDRNLAVVHQGEQVGEIAVSKAPGEQITKSEEKLLQDLASQAGLAMRNLRLTGELQQKLIELQESRKRIVAAQDQERRRMERDIHDGAQQQLVSLAVKLGLAKTLLSKDPPKASSLLEELRNETDETVETLRDLARGLFPQILVDRGLAEAIDSHVAKMGIDASLQNGIGHARLDLEAEANAYFCIREALQNASKHAAGSSVVITLSTLDGRLGFSVKDDGPGFDMEKAKAGSGLQNMKDRIDALGGSFEIETTPGMGTEVRAIIPARALGVTA